MHIGWNIPSNNDGENKALNNSGVEHFTADPIKSLAREILQNSLDAASVSAERSPEVHFDLIQCSADQFPGLDEFKDILKGCKEYWGHQADSVNFFDKALQMCSGSLIPMLKVSDYFTTGLNGSDSEMKSNWYNMVKSEGASDKHQTAGGSFGIGKNAPYASSAVRTLFYSTCLSDGSVAFQGVAKLVTHLNKNKETTQGTGYYGFTEKNTAIRNKEQIPELFRRSTPGTDIFIMGFDAGADWKANLIKWVIEYFFVAIYKSQLVIKVDGVLINAENLPHLLDEYIPTNDEQFFAPKYYRALTSSEAYRPQIANFKGMGQLELFLFQEKSYPKKVAMVRNTGMKIHDKGRFRTTQRFAGVLLIHGDELNTFLRRLEPPTHDNWHPYRYPGNDDDKRRANRTLDELYAWVRDKISEAYKADNVDEINVDELGNYLPDESQEFHRASQESELEQPGPKSNRPKVVELTTIKNRINNPSPAPETGTQDDDKVNYPQQPTKRRKNEKTQKSKNPHENTSSPKKIISLTKIRAFGENGEYTIIFTPSDSSLADIAFFVSGEDSSEPISLKYAIQITNQGHLPLNVSRNFLGPVNLIKGQSLTIRVTLSSAIRCALEVYAYANEA